MDDDRMIRRLQYWNLAAFILMIACAVSYLGYFLYMNPGAVGNTVALYNCKLFSSGCPHRAEINLTMASITAQPIQARPVGVVLGTLGLLNFLTTLSVIHMGLAAIISLGYKYLKTEEESSDE